MPRHQFRGKVEIAPQQHCPLTGKLSYGTPTEAQDRANILDRSQPLHDRDGARRARRVYQCTEQGGCNGWHITTTPEPQVEQELPPEPEWKKMWLRD
jgi:hypothetical protein